MRDEQYMNQPTLHAPTTLLLCRHGQSEWNAQSRVQGQAPEADGLTGLGRWQAQRLALRPRDQGVTALYASDLLRAPIANTSATVVQVNSAGRQAALIADASHLDGAAPENASNADEQR